MNKNLVRTAIAFSMTAVFLSQFATTASAFGDMQTLLGQQSEVAQIQQADAISALYKKKDAEDSLTIQSFYRFPVIAENFKGMSTKFSFFHPGYDIRANYGAEIYPVRDGVIAKVEYETGGYGRYVIVKHENGMETLYAHMSKTDAQVGDTVKMDTVIGYVGSSGHSTGAHIHFEVRVDEKRVNPGLILPETQALAGTVNTIASK